MKKIINSIFAIALLSYSTLAQQTPATSNSGTKNSNTNTNTNSNRNNTPANSNTNSTNNNANSSTNNNVNNSADNNPDNATMTNTTSSSNAAMDVNQNDYTVQQYYDRMETDRMNSYTLTADQRNRLNTINSNYDRSMNTLKSNSALSNADRMNQWNTMRSERRRQYMDLLSPADRTKYQTFANDWGNNYITVDELRSRANLTDEQYTKMSELNNGFTQRELQLINNQSMNSDERNKQLMAIAGERNSVYRTIMSADQITKLDRDSDGSWKIKTKTNGQKQKIKTKPVNNTNNSNTNNGNTNSNQSGQ